MANNTNKITKTMNFNRLATIVAESPISAEEKTRLTDFISHELELIAKKKASKSETPQDKANNTTMSHILDALFENPNGMTITELTKVPYIAEIEGNSTHRISALVTKLKNAGKVTRTEVKGVAYFSLSADAEEVGE